MAAKRKTKKKITLSEFKTWLAGVQSMQPEGWHPNKENWAMILDQIDNITETVVEKEVIIKEPVEHHQSASFNNHMQHDGIQNDPRNPAYQASLPPPQYDEVHSSMNDPSLIDPQRPPSIGKQLNNGAIDVEIKDTGGAYESSFAD